MSRNGAPPQAEVTKSLWSTMPGVDEGDLARLERRRQGGLDVEAGLLEFGHRRHVAVARGGRIGADEEGVAARTLGPADELVALAVERVEQHDPADPPVLAPDSQRVDRRHKFV